MSEPINLNKVRKERQRAERRRQAYANAARFGRTKAEKARDEAQAKREAERLDGHRRDDGEA